MICCAEGTVIFKYSIKRQLDEKFLQKVEAKVFVENLSKRIFKSTNICDLKKSIT